MSNLPPYSGDTNEGVDCIKCGFYIATTEYMPPAKGILPHTLPGVGGTTHDEFLKRTCDRCGYEWAEACMPN